MKERNSQSSSSANLSETNKPFLSMGMLEKKALTDVIQEEGLIVEYLINKMIWQSVPFFENLWQKFGRGDHLAMLRGDVKRRHMCPVFICMQLVSTIGWPLSVHRCSNFASYTNLSQFDLCFPCSCKSAEISFFCPTRLSKSRCFTVSCSRRGPPVSQLVRNHNNKKQ